MLSEKVKIAKGLSPAADTLAGTKYTDVVNAGLADETTFLVFHKGGTTGKSTLTVQACDNVTPSNRSAVAFRYRRMTTGASDTWGDISDAEATGIDTVPGEDTIIEISVKSSELTAGYPFVQLKAVEAVDDPVVAAIIIIQDGVRYGGASQPSALS